MDEKFIEIADAVTQAEIAAGIAKAQHAQKKPVGFDGTCPECGEHIPEPRVSLGFFNCVSCQSKIEHRTKMSR